MNATNAKETGIQLTLEKPVYGGDCLSHLPSKDGRPGKAVFVPLTLPGEEISAHVTEEKRSFAKAEVDAILVPSPHRVDPPCPHYGLCGGCSYQHADYPAQLALKRQILHETLSRAGVAIPAEIGVLHGDPWAYRNRIRLALTPSATAESSLAYRGRRSHDLISIHECPIAAPILLCVAEQVASFCSQAGVPVTISEIELFTNHDESQLLLTLFSESAPVSNPEPWLESLKTALPPVVTSLRLQLADGGFVPQILATADQSHLAYRASGFDYQVHHGAFFQVNRWLINDFVSLVTAGGSGNLAWDLYAGVGLFARQLSASFTQVIAVESSPASFPSMERNLAGSRGIPTASTTLDFLRHNREQREPRPDLIVLDPPRAGLGEETTTLLNAIYAPAMVYVSCDPATLARDLRALTQERYSVSQVTLVDMFPQTFHLETVVQLEKR
jgi:23S rRNA (uracil1939-C5)-methyltransferase